MMMKKNYTLIINKADCVGCQACEVACKQEHDLPVGPRWIKVYTDAPREIEGRQQLRYTVTHCMHCGKPECKEACPLDAITKRDDGIVLVDANLCNGCGLCVEACPLGVMQFGEDKGVAQKCDLCYERIDKGQSPACVASCPAHCIYFGDVTDVSTRLGEQKLSMWLKNLGF